MERAARSPLPEAQVDSTLWRRSLRRRIGDAVASTIADAERHGGALTAFDVVDVVESYGRELRAAVTR